MDTIKETILIVEDDLGLNELISERIQQTGFDTFAAFSAGEAFDWLKANNPLMMLLDYSLPDMTGKELLENLNVEGIDLPPFVVATGQGDERIAVEMMKLGAKDYILKDRNFLEMIPIVIAKTTEAVEKEQILQLTELELKESYRFNQQIIEGAQEGIVVFDSDMRFKVFNPYMEKITGIPVDEVIGKHLFDIPVFLKDSGVVDLIERALRGEVFDEIDVPFDIPMTGKSGWTSDKSAPLFNHSGEIIGVITTVHDITVRKQSEVALSESEANLSEAIFIANLGFWKYDIDSGMFTFNDQFYKLYHTTAEKEGGYLMSTSNYTKKFVHPDDMHVVADEIQKALQTNGSNYSFLVDHRIICTDGQLKYITVSIRIIKDDHGRIISMNGVNQDITERKLAEENLRISEVKFRNIFENSIVGKSITTLDGKVSVNKAFSDIIGYSLEELSNMNWREFTYKDDIEYNAKEINSLLKGEKNFSQWEKRYIHKNRSIVWVHISIVLLRDIEGNPTHFISEIYNITERKLAEQALQEKMNELLDFHRLTVGRELKMIDLKKEVNKLLEESGSEPKYYIVQ
jgi:PAS domain S-box-containing protein